MPESSAIVVVLLDASRYAFWLSVVERVIPIVAVTPLPKAPKVVLGIIDVRGKLVPVVDLRQRFGLPRREPELSAQLVIARTPRRRLAVLVDRVQGVDTAPTLAPSQEVSDVPTEYVAGVVRGPDGLVLIHDLDEFLSLDEERLLDAALAPPEVSV